jgi:uncharacterized protein (DUF2062 family)
MNGQRSEDRLYTGVVLAFLIGLVALGLLGIPALLVAAIGAILAAIAIGAFHGPLERLNGSASDRRRRRRKVPARYVPSVLEQSSVRRRRGLHLRGHRHA